MDIIFEVKDQQGRKIYLSKKQYKHILKHPHMHGYIENIKNTLQNPTTLRYNVDDNKVAYFYKEFKSMRLSEKYLFISVKYLNGKSFIITSYFTNKIKGLKWKIR